MSAPASQPPAKRPRTEQKGGDVMESLLTVNNLKYTTSHDLSVSVARTYVNSHFASQLYNANVGTRAICVSNTGSNFVALHNSFVTITVNNLETGPLTWGPHGSVCNIFNSLSITARSGEVVDSSTRSNALACLYDRSYRTADWFASVGAAAGYRQTLTSGDIDLNEIPGGGSRTYVVPLSSLFALARVQQLTPSVLASGLRWEFVTDSPQYSAIWTAPLISGGYTLSMTMSFDCFTLSDSASRALTAASANSGLAMSFVSEFCTEQTQLSNNVDEIRKSCSRALSVTSFHRPAEGASPHSVDFFSSPPINYTSWSTRLGSLLFPQAKLIGTTPEISTRLYHMTVNAIGKNKQAATPLRYHTWAGHSSVTSGFRQITTSLERSDLSENSGVPSNSSRTLVIESSCTSPVGLMLHILRLQTVLLVFLNNVSIAQ